MKKILVTGASGFIGSYCIKMLIDRNYEIHTISRKSIENLVNENVSWYNVDLFNNKKIESVFKKVRPTFFMHLAWKMETGLNLNSENNEKWLNLSKNLISLFHRYGGKRILISGSCFEYDLNHEILTENSTPLNANNEYGKSKNRLYQYLKSYGAENDLSYIWPRIFFAFGPGQKEQSLLPYVMTGLMNNSKIELTDGNQRYDYIYVKDVALALILLLESSYNGDVNVSSGKVIKLKDLILKIARIFDRENLLNFGILSRPQGSPDFVLGNNELLKKVTSWNENYGIDNGITEFIDYYKSKNNQDTLSKSK